MRLPIITRVFQNTTPQSLHDDYRKLDRNPSPKNWAVDRTKMSYRQNQVKHIMINDLAGT